MWAARPDTTVTNGQPVTSAESAGHATNGTERPAHAYGATEPAATFGSTAHANAAARRDFARPGNRRRALSRSTRTDAERGVGGRDR